MWWSRGSSGVSASFEDKLRVMSFLSSMPLWCRETCDRKSCGIEYT